MIGITNIQSDVLDKGTATGTVSGTGSNMIWNWVKYIDGRSMCHGIASSTRSSSGAGNVHYATGADPCWTFPSGLFIETPTLEISMQETSGANWLWVGTGATTTKDVTCKIMPFYYTSYSGITVKFGLVAHGKWK